MAINTKPDILLYIILLFLIVWIIISGSPQRKFKRLKDEFGIKDFDADKMEEVRKAIEVLNTKSDNIITFDDIIAVKYKNKNIPIGYGIATKLRERYGGWFHQSAKFFLLLFLIILIEISLEKKSPYSSSKSVVKNFLCIGSRIFQNCIRF